MLFVLPIWSVTVCCIPLIESFAREIKDLLSQFYQIKLSYAYLALLGIIFLLLPELWILDLFLSDMFLLPR